MAAIGAIEFPGVDYRASDDDDSSDLLSIGAILFTIIVSGTIGVLAGVFPAWKAARLDPIEALRAD
jgi:putative ABC transport system permease protein